MSSHGLERKIEIPQPVDIRILILSGVALVHIVLRFVNLGASSLWSSEGFNWGLAMNYDTYTPLTFLYHGSLRAWISIAGDSEFALRLLPALFSIGLIVMTFLIGNDLYDRRTGFVAALLLSILPIDFYHAREAKFYEGHAFTAALFVYLLSRACATRKLIPILFAAGAAILNALYMPFFLPSSITLSIVGFLLFTQPPSWKRIFAVCLFGAVALSVIIFAIDVFKIEPFSRFLSLKLSTMHNLSQLISMKSLSSFLGTYAVFMAGLIRYAELFQPSALRTITGAITVLALCAAAVALIRESLRQRSTARSTTFVLVWAFFPPLPFLYIQFVLGSYPYAARYAIGALPAVALILARSLVSTIPVSRRYDTIMSSAKSILFALCLCIAVSSNAAFYHLFSERMLHRWSELFADIATHIERPALVAVGDDDVDNIYYHLKKFGLGRSNITVTYSVDEARQQHQAFGAFKTVVFIGFEDTPSSISLKFPKEWQDLVRRNGIPLSVSLHRQKRFPVLNQNPIITAEILKYSFPDSGVPAPPPHDAVPRIDR